MSLKCGIVGLPNVGKSTLFNAITKAGAESANYPFCTIEPNVGVVALPDKRLDNLSNLYQSKKTIPTTYEFVDIAGLVAGASKGEGLGNQFLAHIREVDAIAHVVRCFENSNITHVSGNINPADDMETINLELILADLDSMEKRLDKLRSKIKSKDKDSLEEFELVEKIYKHLEGGSPARSLAYTKDEEKILKRINLLTNKPIIYVANISEDDIRNRFELPMVKAVMAKAQEENTIAIPVSAQIESEVAQLEADEKREFLNDLGLEYSGLEEIIRATYKLLGLITYFTAGEKESRAWTIKEGTLAPGAAGTIHTDFERGFIKAEVISYEDLMDYKSEVKAKEAGKLRIEGKDYLVKDGDVMHFRFNV
ncbi:MAG: redox-regulated ATPase YchF [Fusobacteria bacterium]|nr:redox-regulated ATPase YchF [Fusobacteriota bacterium]